MKEGESILNLGDPAPEWRAVAVGGPYGDGTVVSSADFKGRMLVLYFYPKDDTPGCAKQACALRDRWAKFRQNGAEIFGVSVDSVASHKSFIAKHSLPFALLSDESHQMVDGFGVWTEQTFNEKKFMGTERTTFVIRPDGRIKSIFRRVAPDEHADLLEDDLAHFVP